MRTPSDVHLPTYTGASGVFGAPSESSNLLAQMNTWTQQPTSSSIDDEDSTLLATQLRDFISQRGIRATTEIILDRFRVADEKAAIFRQILRELAVVKNGVWVLKKKR